LPSFQYVIFAQKDTSKFALLASENSSSTSWLRTYRSSKGITYPMAFDSTGSAFGAFQVGASFGNAPPTYLLIDKSGIVRYRSDGVYYLAGVISAKITDLIAEP
jgi:hypothetical protein